MSAKPAREHLRLVKVDNATGEAAFVESDALATLEAELVRLQAENTKLKTDRKMLRRDVTTKNRKISDLERNRAWERLNHPDRQMIERVATYWHKRCRNGHPRINPMSPARFDALAALIEMEEITVDEGVKMTRRRYGPHDFKAAIDGAHFDHYAKKRKNGSEQHFDDLELICRDSKQFEEFIARCPYEVVPLAREPRARNTPGRFQAKTEVRSHDVVAGGSGRALVPEQAGWPHVRGGVGARVANAPASVA